MERADVEVTGGPREFAIVRDAFEGRGVTVQGDLPAEERGGGAPQEVVWIFVGIGLTKAVDAAEAYLKAKWPQIRLRIRRGSKD